MHIGPASSARLTAEPSLLAEVVKEFAHRPTNAPGRRHSPLLSRVLFELAESPAGRELTLERYRGLGGLESALRWVADEALGSLDDEEHQRAARLVFAHLVQLGTDAHPTRRRTLRTMVTWLLDEEEEEALERIAASIGDPVTAEEWAHYIPGHPYQPGS